jgi:hypothetical protein
MKKLERESMQDAMWRSGRQRVCTCRMKCGMREESVKAEEERYGHDEIRQ